MLQYATWWTYLQCHHAMSALSGWSQLQLSGFHESSGSSLRDQHVGEVGHLVVLQLCTYCLPIKTLQGWLPGSHHGFYSGSTGPARPAAWFAAYNCLLTSHSKKLGTIHVVAAATSSNAEEVCVDSST